MALAHSDTIRTAVADLVVDAIDAGSGHPNGQLVLQDIEDAEVATIEFGAPAFGAAVAGIAAANSVVADGSATGGSAATFKIVNKSGTTILTGTFGTTGADLLGAGVEIGAGDTVDIVDGDLSYEAMP